MGESLCIDSPSRGLAMPKSYSGDLRERVIEAVETGASRREAAEHFGVSVSSARPLRHYSSAGRPSEAQRVRGEIYGAIEVAWDVEAMSVGTIEETRRRRCE